jgi:class 3 adenylate cyclase
MSKGIQKVSTLNDRQSGGRRLAALMFTDMVGYSTLTAKDEVLSLQLVAEQQAIIKSLFPRFGGVRMRTIGDGCFMEFGSAIESVLCAREIQTRIRDRNAAAPSDQQIQLRIGIHLGDIIDFDGDSYGDGVNIAARIETQANPGGIFLTRQVHDQVVGNIPDRLIGVGKVELKNIPKPVEVYRVEMPWESKSLKASWLRSIKKAWFFSEGRQPKQSIWRRTVFGFLGVMVFGILATTCFSIWTNMVVQEAPNEVIKGAWEYSVIDQNGAVGPWNEFKVSHRYTYADAIKGNYWLRTKFKLEHPYESPSLVIGQLPQGSSLYLNGRFIGTGNQFGIVQSFFI